MKNCQVASLRRTKQSLNFRPGLCPHKPLLSTAFGFVGKQTWGCNKFKKSRLLRSSQWRTKLNIVRIQSETTRSYKWDKSRIALMGISSSNMLFRKDGKTISKFEFEKVFNRWKNYQVASLRGTACPASAGKQSHTVCKSENIISISRWV